MFQLRVDWIELHVYRPLGTSREILMHAIALGGCRIHCRRLVVGRLVFLNDHGQSIAHATSV